MPLQSHRKPRRRVCNSLYPQTPWIYSPWTLRQRDRIAAMHVEARECLAEAHASAGEFALSGLPAGTQTLEVRVIGFEPKRRTVELRRDSLTKLDVVLDRPVQTLDAVKVYGTGNVAMAEFERRLKSGWGHFLTPNDIANRHATRATDLFRMIPGVRVAPMRRSFGNAILMRGNCRPTVYLNGMRMDDNAATEIDDLANPEEITGVEVYTAAGRPAEFWGNSCGSVVLWVGMLPR